MHRLRARVEEGLSEDGVPSTALVCARISHSDAAGFESVAHCLGRSTDLFEAISESSARVGEMWFPECNLRVRFIVSGLGIVVRGSRLYVSRCHLQCADSMKTWFLWLHPGSRRRNVQGLGHVGYFTPGLKPLRPRSLQCFSELASYTHAGSLRSQKSNPKH